MKKWHKKIYIITSIIVICATFFLSIGYSAFSQKLLIDDIGLEVRIKEDIRITDISLEDTNNAVSSQEDYNVSNIFSNISLPDASSSITYKVQITNFGNIEMGILNITGLPENLEYTIEGYNLQDKICVEQICKLGIQKDIYITIKYKSTGYNQDKTSYNINMVFDFRPFHKITYENIIDDSYPKEVIDSGTFEMIFTKPYPIGAKPFINDIETEYRYEKDNLIVENVTNDLTIKAGYIQSIEDLLNLSEEVNEGLTYFGTNFMLEKDLDFTNPTSYRDSNRRDYGNINGDNSSDSLLQELTSGTGWIPIGVLSNKFKGTFDGKKNKIENLYINNNTSNLTLGLFGDAENTTIKDLNIYGTIKTSVSTNIGGLIGRANGNINIENFENHIDINGLEKAGSTGGIIGSSSADSVISLKNINNYGNISDGNQASGLIAWLIGKVTIDNCHNYGNITLNNSDSMRVGGLVGSTSTNKDIEITIINSSNEGTIFGSHNAGGLVGLNNGGYIKLVILNSYNKGKVSGKHAGGLIGYSNNKESTTIYNSYNIGDITGSAYASGIFGYIESSTESITMNNIYNSGLITSERINGITIDGSTSNGNILIENAYYLAQSTNYGNEFGISMQENEMKNQEFVSRLNSYVNTNEKVNINNTQYNLYYWQIKDNNYPSLIIND